jgi:hypothetical protein
VTFCLPRYFSQIAISPFDLHYPIDLLHFTAGGDLCSPRSRGIGAEPGHSEHRKPSTRLPADASG